MRLLSFSEGAHAQLARALRKVKKGGAKGIVLDLRHNPGGLLEGGGAVPRASSSPRGSRRLDQLADPGEERLQDRAAGGCTALPLVVLIDRGTASAAEILTAALADDGGAEVVGTRSFGKGVFQEEQALANGGALKLTVGEYFTPKGVNLAESHGIHPDVKVQDDPKTKVDEAEERALEALAGQVGG